MSQKKIWTNATKSFLDHLSAVVEGKEMDASNPATARIKKLAERQDELGEMIRNVQQTVVSIGVVIRTISEATGKLTAATGAFQGSFEDMSKAVGITENEITGIVNNTSSQADSTADMKLKIDAMGQAIDNIVSSINALSASAENVKKCNESAESIMLELVKINDQNGKAIEQVKAQTEKTNQSVNEIQSATDIISGIADQTNLLALNASIEAARAGEQGKGFAVVADEIRVLADQSRESAEQIANVVNELMANSESSVRITEQVADAFALQTEKISSTQEIFGELNNEIIVVADTISSIDGEVVDLAGHKDVVETSINNLNDLAEQNAKSADVTLDSVSTLKSAVDTCTETTEEIVDVSTKLTDALMEIKANSERKMEEIQKKSNS